MRLLDVKVGDLRLIRMDDLGLGCGWFEIIIILGVPFGFDESLGEWRVVGGGYRRSVSVSGIQSMVSVCGVVPRLGHPSLRLGSSVLG